MTYNVSGGTLNSAQLNSTTDSLSLQVYSDTKSRNILYVQTV